MKRQKLDGMEQSVQSGPSIYESLALVKISENNYLLGATS